MKDIIFKIVQANFTLEIKRELMMCQITVKKLFEYGLSDRNSYIECTQMIPLDDHMDYALEKCIEYCFNNVMEMVAQYKANL